MEINKNLNLLTSPHPNIKVGRYCYGSPQLMLWNSDTDYITIGSFCSFADQVMIMGGGEHRSDWLTAYPLRMVFDQPGAGLDGTPKSKGLTYIGNDVWIGSRVTILSNSYISDGCIIGAGSVVTGQIPLYSIAAGNPAKVIRQRFPGHVVSKITSLGWWDWPIEKILENVDLLCSDAIEFYENFNVKRLK